MKYKFRFQDYVIWQKAIQINDDLLDKSDELEGKKLYRFAEQLRSASMSISNNIAEGSGSSSQKDFANFLNHAHRSIFEVVNILIILTRRQYLTDNKADELIIELEVLSKQIMSFKKSLFK